jgi:prevent-host-death family protein
MTTLTASEARAGLYRLIDQAAESHKPIVISGKRSNAVLISEEDWSAIQETLYLLAIPGKACCPSAANSRTHLRKTSSFMSRSFAACTTETPRSLTNQTASILNSLLYCLLFTIFYLQFD